MDRVAPRAVELAAFVTARGRRLALVAVVPLVAVGGALVLASIRPAQHEASVAVLVPVVGPDVAGSLPTTESFRAILTGRAVARRAAAEAARSPSAVRARLRAIQVGRGNLVEVRYRDADRAVAPVVVGAAVTEAFDRLYAVEVDSARRWAARAGGAAAGTTPPAAAEALAAVDRLTARRDAAAAQVDGIDVRRVPTGGGEAARAAALSLLLVGVILAVWERARPVVPSRRAEDGRVDEELVDRPVPVGAGR